MVKPLGLHGIWSAVPTPLDADLDPDLAKAVAFYRELLAGGCDGINVLGSTGEAMSLSVAQRRRLMEAIAAGGVPMDRAMVGIGAAALHDAVALAQTAFDCGFTAALVMPPFFYRDASDDGILRFFDALLALVRAPLGGVLLYNFPLMSGITFSPDLVDRLMEAFPGTIAGLKDSSNDRAFQVEILKRRSGFAVFPGSEHYLLEAKGYGAAGCISGSVCLWPRLAQDVFTREDAGGMLQLATRREILTGMPFIAAVRFFLAEMRGDSTWERSMPPLVPLSDNDRLVLRDRLLGVEALS